MDVSAKGYVNISSKTLTLDGTLLQQGVDYSLFKGGVTIKGLVTNAAGEPLPGYPIKPTVNGKTLGTVHSVTKDCPMQGTHVLTGRDGRFELINCPAIDGLAATASGTSKPGNWDFYMKRWEKTGEFVYYDSKTVEVGYEQGANEYYVEISLDEPEITIEFEVKDADGNPLEGIDVRLKAADDFGNGHTTTTNENGKCVFHKFPRVKRPWLYVQLLQLREDKELSEAEKQQREKLRKYYPVIKPIELSENVKKYKVDVTLSQAGKLTAKEVVVHEIED